MARGEATRRITRGSIAKVRVEVDGAPGRSRTSDLLVRSQLLYPAELRAHIALLQLGKNTGDFGLEQG